MRPQIAFVDDPEGFVAPEIPLFKPKSVAGLYVLITGPKIEGLFLHWNGARDIPHILGTCQGCERGMPVRWSGYVSACCLDEGEASDRCGGHGFFEITDAGKKQITAMMGGRTMTRGLALHARRKDSRRNAKVLLREVKLAARLELPAHLDARGFIRRLYSLPKAVIPTAAEQPQESP